MYCRNCWLVGWLLLLLLLLLLLCARCDLQIEPALFEFTSILYLNSIQFVKKTATSAHAPSSSILILQKL